MILSDYFYPQHDITWDYAVQCGVHHGVIRLPETSDFRLTEESDWQTLCDRFRSAGITPLVIEPLPNCLHDHIKAGDAQRDESIETFIKMLPLMVKQGIRTVCFNFMAYVGWARTQSDFPERGGALSTAFFLKDYQPTQDAITQDQLWQNYFYFIKAVLPEAEKYGVQLALHPDDPPLARLGNVQRIMISLENIRRAVETHPSDFLGVTFCQACYAEMGEDVAQCARIFGKKIFFVHFRNVLGTAEGFHETFHDNGSIRMADMLRVYKELGLNVPIRVDHVPLMGRPEEIHESHLPAGYSAVGRLYAIGYLKGLLEMSEKF